MENPNIKTKVLHSKSKDAWNIVGTELGKKHKIARIPYLITGNEIIDKREKDEALNHAQFISECFNGYHGLNTILKKELVKKFKFEFYATEDAPFIGAYRAGSFNEGKAQIMFSMDFFTFLLKDEEKGNLLPEFKDGIIQTISHEFIHALEEFIGREVDEYKVEKCLEAYKPSWGVFNESIEGEIEQGIISIKDLLEFIDDYKSSNLSEFKNKVKQMFQAEKHWIEAVEKDGVNKV